MKTMTQELFIVKKRSVWDYGVRKVKLPQGKEKEINVRKESPNSPRA